MVTKNIGLLDEDYMAISSKLSAKKFIRLADVADKIEKVAFDVVRFRNTDGLDKLWVVQDHNGEQVLVAMYDDEDLEYKTASTKTWQVIPDKTGVNIYYKDEPIKRYAMSELHLDVGDASFVARYLPSKLAEDKDFSRSLLKELPESDRNALFTKYPELRG